MDKKNDSSKFIKKIINKTKTIKNKLLLEYKLKTKYKEKSTMLKIYNKDKPLFKVVYGTINNNEFTIYGKHNINKGDIVISGCRNEAYKVISFHSTTIFINYCNKDYDKEGMKLLCVKANEKYGITKVGKRFFEND